MSAATIWNLLALSYAIQLSSRCYMSWGPQQLSRSLMLMIPLLVMDYRLKSIGPNDLFCVYYHSLFIEMYILNAI